MRRDAAGERGLYFPTLDGLRFVAFLLVFIHHLPASSSSVLSLVKDQGWVGVHLFLVLSAYLLTSILQREHQLTGGVSIARFYVRRGLRIWPLYVAFVVVVVGWTFAKHQWREDSLLRVGGLLLFVDNVISGFQGMNRLPFSGHLWTISLEEQFYLVLPWLLSAWLAHRRRLRFALMVLWLLNVLARSVAVSLSAPHPLIWTSVFSADALVFGTAIAALESRPERGGLAVLSLVGVGGLFSGALLSPMSEVGPHQVALYVLVGAGASALCIACLHAPWFRFLGVGPLRYLGKISYGLYVFHFVGIAAAEVILRRLGVQGWGPMFLVAMAATVALSALSYEVFERHFLKLKRRFETVHSRAP